MNSMVANREDITRLQNGKPVFTKRKRYPKLKKGAVLLRHRYDHTNTIHVYVRRILFWLVISPM